MKILSEGLQFRGTCICGCKVEASPREIKWETVRSVFDPLNPLSEPKSKTVYFVPACPNCGAKFSVTPTQPPAPASEPAPSSQTAALAGHSDCCPLCYGAGLLYPPQSRSCPRCHGTGKVPVPAPGTARSTHTPAANPDTAGKPCAPDRTADTGSTPASSETTAPAPPGQDQAPASDPPPGSPPLAAPSLPTYDFSPPAP